MSEKTIDEIRSDQSASNRTIKSDAELYTSLLAHPGWRRYVELLETVGQNFHKTVMSPLNNTLECVKGEFAKGALTGLSLAAGLPASKIREAQELNSTDNRDEG